MRIIPRTEWGARYQAGFGPAPLPAQFLYLHHSVSGGMDLLPPFDDDYQAVRQLEKIGQDRFGGGISYTFPITPAGLIFEGHGINRVGAHTKGRNTTGRAIVWVGNYDVNQPTEMMLDATAWLIDHGARQSWWPRQLTGGHRDAPGALTACPGRYAYELIHEVNRRVGAVSDASTSFEKYTVQDGDTLWSIARKFGTTVSVIQGLNRLSASLINPGQILRVPGSKPPPLPNNPAPVVPTSGSLKLGMKNNELVKALQRFMNLHFPKYSKLAVDGDYGPATAKVIAEFQRNARVTGADADGTIVGPRTWAALREHGWR